MIRVYLVNPVNPVKKCQLKEENNEMPGTGQPVLETWRYF